jgi:hypothetical protein
MIPALLAQIGLPMLIKTITSALDKMTSPIAKTAAATLKQVDDAITNGDISSDDVKESNRHIEQMTTLESDEYKTAMEQVNTSLRTEAASTDAYVRRMRPTFGYIMAFTWAAQMLAIAFVILETPDKAITVMNAMSNLDTIWTVGLSVLGIYVYKRSQEKSGAIKGGK